MILPERERKRKAEIFTQLFHFRVKLNNIMETSLDFPRIVASHFADSIQFGQIIHDIRHKGVN